MALTIRIGLIGDYNPEVNAHKAIPLALEMAARAASCEVEGVWLPTETLTGEMAHNLAGFDALWCVPASPYASMEGALRAIQYARESGRPYLGTCGGFQHSLIEYARNVLGLAEADHAESNPAASVMFVGPLTCALRDAYGTIQLEPGSHTRAIYGKSETVEEYNCSFGLNPAYRALLEGSSLQITGVDQDNDVRIVELPGHPFYMATLFQPERAALKGTAHPLVNAFVQAAAAIKAESAVETISH